MTSPGISRTCPMNSLLSLSFSGSGSSLNLPPERSFSHAEPFTWVRKGSLSMR